MRRYHCADGENDGDQATFHIILEENMKHFVVLVYQRDDLKEIGANKFKLYNDFTRDRSDVLPSFLLQVKISKAKKNSDLFLSGDRLFTELQSHLCLVNSWIE